MPAMQDIPRDSDGKLPASTDLGGYPLYYVCKDGGCLCPKCANQYGQTDSPDDAQWHLIGGDVHWEGAPIVCDHCNAEVESAYGDPAMERPQDM